MIMNSFYTAYDLVDDHSLVGKKVFPYLIEVELKDREDGFLIVKETLERIGVAIRYEDSDYKELRQTVHLLHKQGRYFLCHFKILRRLDGLYRERINTKDIDRQNRIITLLSRWDLVDIINPELMGEKDYTVQNFGICVVKGNERDEWNMKSQYKIGEKK